MAFADLLVHSATILQRKAGAQDAHGNTPSDLVVQEDNVPCRVASGRSRPRENQAGTKYSYDYLTIFMMPRAYALTEHHWLKIDNKMMNIMQVLSVAGSTPNHHLEIVTLVIKP